MSARPKTLDHLRSKKKPYTRKVSLICDSDLADALDALNGERDELKDRERSAEFLSQPVPGDLRRSIEDVDARLAELRPQVEEATETFVFRGIGRRAYDRLLDEHPPTAAQRERNKDRGMPEPEHNPDSFQPALCAAACVSHEATFDDWKALFADEDQWNAAELGLLFLTAHQAQMDARVVDMGKGSAATRN